MQEKNLLETPHSRRLFLRGTSTAALSAGALMMLAGQTARAAGAPTDAASDVGILNVALGLECQGINAYTLGAKSGLLQKPVLAIALQFQDDHKAHRDILIAAITRLGGKPVEEKAPDAYAKALNAGTLKSQEDVLRRALALESGATDAYLGVIPAFKDHGYAKVAARIAADEVAHWAILNNALGLPLPKAMMFGA
ncbi:MAG TPA: DUF4439 domain-containing protein [Janthinobacterium sp.]|nr:DUF4439 domain-containing protein [Janthinobacterium sp.]